MLFRIMEETGKVTHHVLRLIQKGKYIRNLDVSIIPDSIKGMGNILIKLQSMARLLQKTVIAYYELKKYSCGF